MVFSGGGGVEKMELHTNPWRKEKTAHRKPGGLVKHLRHKCVQRHGTAVNRPGLKGNGRRYKGSMDKGRLGGWGVPNGAQVGRRQKRFTEI